MTDFVVIGQHYWGRGETLDKAKRRFRQEGGELSRGYSILAFPDDSEFVGVNTVTGAVEWHGPEPEVTEVPRKR